MHQRSAAGDVRCQHTSFLCSMDEGRRLRLKSPLTLSARQCDSKELLLQPIVEISRLVSCFCRLSRMDRNLGQQVWSGTLRDHIGGWGYRDGICNDSSRNLHQGRAQRKDNKIEQSCAVRVDGRASRSCSAAGIVDHSRIFVDTVGYAWLSLAVECCLLINLLVHNDIQVHSL